jgi:hypothetical protein
MQIINRAVELGSGLLYCDSGGLSLLERFVKIFINEGKQESFLLNIHRAGIKQRPADYYRGFRANSVRDWSTAKDALSSGLLQWLCGVSQSDHCHLLFGEPGAPIFYIDVQSLRDPDFFFFSDSYWVDFGAKRSVVVTRDGDVILCQSDRGELE